MAQTLRSSIKGALNRSIKGGLLSPAQFRGSTLDLDFAGAKSLKNQIGKEDVVSFTRASSGTYVGSDGLIKTATTNLVLRSEEFDQSPWFAPVGITVTPNAEIAPNGTLTADRVQWDIGNKGLSQSFTGLIGVSYALSVWVKGAAGETIRFGGNNIAANNYTLTGQWQRLEITGISSSTSLNITINTFAGVTARDLYVWGAQLEQSSTVGEYVKTTSTINSAPRFDHDPTTGESLGLLVEEQRSNLLLNSGTLATQDVTVTAVAHTLSFYGSGTVALSGTHTATVVGTGAYPARTTLTFTPTAGTLTVTVSGTVEYANLEIGSFATSYIPTTGSTVTRAADVASIEGANFSSWYRQDEGSAFVDFTINGVNTGNNFIYDFSNGTIDEEIFLNYQDTGNARWVARIAGVQTTQDQNGAGLPRFKHAFGMASNNYMVARDGILSTGSSQVGMPSNTSLRLGARFNDFAASNGTIRRLTYWPTRLPDSTLQTITQ